MSTPLVLGSTVSTVEQQREAVITVVEFAKGFPDEVDRDEVALLLAMVLDIGPLRNELLDIDN